MRVFRVFRSWMMRGKCEHLGRPPSPLRLCGVRPRDPDYYLGAYVPASGDKPKAVRVPLDLEEAIPVLQKHFDVEKLVEKLCRRPAKG